jgi:hypothetical protein
MATASPAIYGGPHVRHSQTPRRDDRAACVRARHGEHWQLWVVRLVEIFKRHGLPAEVRKDSAKSSKPQSEFKHSPFVILLHELQGRIPSKFRRATHSKFALAEAITAARRRQRV